MATPGVVFDTLLRDAGDHGYEYMFSIHAFSAFCSEDVQYAVEGKIVVAACISTQNPLSFNSLAQASICG